MTCRPKQPQWAQVARFMLATKPGGRSVEYDRREFVRTPLCVARAGSWRRPMLRGGVVRLSSVEDDEAITSVLGSIRGRLARLRLIWSMSPASEASRHSLSAATHGWVWLVVLSLTITTYHNS
jgi:hypothetical protein